MRILLTVTVVCSFLLLGCDEPFSPKGHFEDIPVAYVILSNLGDTHFARLYKTYDLAGYDPFDNQIDHPVTGALIRVSDGALQWDYRDTVVARADTSRYTTPINAYVASPLQVQRGRYYSLLVQVPGESPVTSTVLMPEKGFVSIYKNLAGISSPFTVADRTIGVRGTVPTTTKGYLIRFHVTFDALENSVWVPHEIEIPYYISNLGALDERYLYYNLTRSYDGVGSLGTVITQFADFDVDSYVVVISRLYSKYGSGGVHFKKGIFTLTQVEPRLYNYYNISRGFRDPSSIRLDSPDYTGFPNAAGVFGAFAVDSLVVNLPTSL